MARKKMIRRKVPVMDRLRKFAPEAGVDECWPFMGFCTDKGYGMIWDGHRSCFTHRVAYEDKYGPIGSVMVCHSCDNPPCTNPAHLFTGTGFDNMRDAARKGRLSRGEHRHSAKLTAFDVRYMRTMHGIQNLYGADIRATEKELAEESGVARENIVAIVHRKTWKHLAPGSEKVWIPKGRPMGDSHHMGRLSAFDVRYIRAMYAMQQQYGVDLGARQGQLAKEFGVTRGSINCIVHRKSWKHLAPGSEIVS